MKRNEKNLISRTLQYLKSIINAESKESSKRFIALFTMLLTSYVVIRFTNDTNAIQVIGELLLFVLVLLGMAVWQNVNKFGKQNDKDK